MAYIFSLSNKTRFKKQGDGQANWTTANPDNAASKTTKTIHGLSIEICVEKDEPSKHASNKEKALKDAIKRIQDAGIMFVNADVKKFRVVYYGALATLPSRGAVFFENTTDTKPCVLLQLGTRLAKHVTVDTTASQSMQGPNAVGMIKVAGGVRGRPPRVVADRIYDYYKPTLTVSEKEKCAVAQALHELGHIIHQLNSPDDYWLNADVAGGDAMALLQRQAEFDEIKEYGLKFISNYAGTDGKSLNEYVAEVFSGMLMGIPWDTIDNHILQTYDALGGVRPVTMPASISRVNDFKAGSCTCIANDHGEAFKYW